MTYKSPTARLAFVLVLFGGMAAPSLAEAPTFPTPRATWTASDWNTFSQNLVAGLAGENEGVKLSALQLIVRHGDRLNVRAAEHDVARLLRHKDRQVRRLAAVACSQLKSEWAMGFLRMSEPFEIDNSVRATIHSIVSEVH